MPLGDCFLHRLVKDSCFKRQRKGDTEGVSESCSRGGNHPCKGPQLEAYLTTVAAEGSQLVREEWDTKSEGQPKTK